MAPKRQTCPNCGSTDIDTDAARGDAVCIQCGTVLEENTIVNEVTFAQDSTGGSAVVGQFVAATPGVSSSGLGFGKESREVAFTNGQRHISQLAQGLRLAEHHQEAAQRLFMLAVQHNFIQGRRTQHVIAACLYTVCRREKTPHLLIDFSDVLQTNVYMLGSCFLKFTRLLSLVLPIIDPSLYIHRFASKLEFGEKTHLVSMSALRLVQRMKRDWIQTGRRPSGICGAALLIAARVHGFRRTQREVVRVVRICEVTLRKRLSEFADTPVGALTARELETTDIEALPASDPPSFTRNRNLEAHQRAQLTMSEDEKAKEAHVAEIRSLKVLELRSRLATYGEDVADPEENAMAQEMLQVLNDPMVVALERTASTGIASGAGADAAAEGEAASGSASGEGRGRGDGPAGSSSSGLGASASSSHSAWFAADLLPSRDDFGEGEDGADQATLMAELNDDLETLDDDISAYIITDEAEVEGKRAAWDSLHQDYLEQQAEKMAARAEAGEKPSGGKPGGRGSSKRARQEQRDASAPESVAEAVAGELRRNKLSSRINYEVVQILSRTLAEDVEHMPDEPGPIAHLDGLRGVELGHDQPLALSRHSASDRRDFSDHLSVQSSYDGNDEPQY